jgi:hypothetical protein
MEYRQTSLDDQREGQRLRDLGMSQAEEGRQWERIGSDDGGLLEAVGNPALAMVRYMAGPVVNEGRKLYQVARDR